MSDEQTTADNEPVILRGADGRQSVLSRLCRLQEEVAAKAFASFTNPNDCFCGEGRLPEHYPASFQSSRQAVEFIEQATLKALHDLTPQTVTDKYGKTDRLDTTTEQVQTANRYGHLIYLASPYADPDPVVQQHRRLIVTTTAAHMMSNPELYGISEKGVTVYSPICHNSALCSTTDFPHGWDFWRRHDLTVLFRCDTLAVLELDGWQNSVGVRGEIEYANEHNIPVIRVETFNNMPSLAASPSLALGLLGNDLPLTISYLASTVHALNAKWWRDIHTGELLTRNRGELLMLMVSELAEAMEGERKSLMDDHLPHRRMAEVELADCLIRILDYCGAFGYDLGGALVEKLRYNTVREDHQTEARLADGGKKW